MKQWEDWIIFLGFRDEQYDDAVSAIGKWKESLAVSGLGGDNLRLLSEELFNIPTIRTYHSCCLGLSSMRVANVTIEAGWVDGGGLSQFDKEYEKVKDRDFSDTYIYPFSGGAHLFFQGVHGAEAGKDRLGGGPQLLCQGFGRQRVNSFFPHHPEGSLHHFFSGKLIFGRHRAHPFCLKAPFMGRSVSLLQGPALRSPSPAVHPRAEEAFQGRSFPCQPRFCQYP